MNFTKKIFAALVIFSSLVITGCGQVQIGYVDAQKIMDEAPQIKAIREESEKKAQEAQAEVQAEMEKHPEWTDEEKTKAAGDAQRKLMGLNQAYATQLKYKLDEVLAEVAKQHNAEVVLGGTKERPAVFKGGIDLTDEVIKKLQ